MTVTPGKQMKSPKTAKQVADISRPKKKRAAAVDTPPASTLTLPKRSILVSDDTAKPTVPGAGQMQVKRVAKSIAPSDAATPHPEPEPSHPAMQPASQTVSPEGTAPGEPTVTPKEPDGGDQPARPKPHAKTTAEDPRQQQQIQQYIENREFFVPIDAVARKRSLKVSVALTFLELLLGIFLINLMLDAGIIQLLEKIPHTNFFNLQ